MKALILIVMVSLPSMGQEAAVYYPEKTSETEKQANTSTKNQSQKMLLQASRQYNVVAYEDAILVYDKIISNDPYNTEAYYGRAICLEALNSWKDALRDYEIVIHLEPEMSEAYFNSGVINFSQGQYTNAIKLFDRLLELPERETQTIYFKGVQNGSNSTPIFDEVVSMADGKDGIVFEYLARCYQELRAFELAEEYFHKALNIQPSADLYVNLGNLKKEMGKNKEALLDYQRALALDPDNSLAIYLLAITAYENGDESISMDVLNRSIAGNNAFPEAYLNRGLLKFQAGEYKAALADYDSALHLNPKMAESWINRGLVKEKLKDYKGALEDYDQATKLESANPSAWLYSGNVNYKMRRFEAALESYDRSIKLDNTNPKAYYNRALVARELNKSDLTCHDLHAAISLGMEEANNVLEAYCSGD